MKALFDVIGVIALLTGLGTCSMAKTAIHEGVGAIIFLICVVALGVGALIGTLERIERALQPKPAPPAPHVSAPPRSRNVKRDQAIAWILGAVAIGGTIGFYLMTNPPK